MDRDEWTIGELERAICFLAANLLRIMAGAGNVTALEKQLREANALANEVARRGWSHADNAMANALQIRFPYLENASTESDRAFNAEQFAINDIVHDALRIAAARLLSDGTNASKNLNELHRGIRRYDEAMDMARNALIQPGKKK